MALSDNGEREKKNAKHEPPFYQESFGNHIGEGDQIKSRSFIHNYPCNINIDK